MSGPAYAWLQAMISAHDAWAVGLLVGLESLGLPLLGAVAGDGAGYLIGRAVGWPFLLRYGRRGSLTRDRLGIDRTLFLQHGGKVVFFGRFVVLLRVLAASLAGASGITLAALRPVQHRRRRGLGNPVRGYGLGASRCWQSASREPRLQRCWCAVRRLGCVWRRVEPTRSARPATLGFLNPEAKVAQPGPEQVRHSCNGNRSVPPCPSSSLSTFLQRLLKRSAVPHPIGRQFHR